MPVGGDDVEGFSRLVGDVHGAGAVRGVGS